MIKITQLLYAACLMLVVSSISSGVRADPISMDVGVEIIAQSHMMWNGQPLPPYSQGQAEISILKYTIPPGAKLPAHIHDYANAGFILSGSLTVYGPDGATRTLHVNDSLIELIGIPHSGANEGDENAVVLVFYAGQMGQPLSRPAP